MVNEQPQAAAGQGDPSWAMMLQELPDDLGGNRLLEVNPVGGEGQAVALAGRGGEIVQAEQPGELLDGAAESFDFVLCRNVLRSTPYPMAMLTDLWRLTTPAGILLIDSEIVPGTDSSRYARFVSAGRSDAGWIPGRLTLRWMVETSGFDVESWLDDTSVTGSSHACLRAIRADREPARSAP